MSVLVEGAALGDKGLVHGLWGKGARVLQSPQGSLAPSLWSPQLGVWFFEKWEQNTCALAISD